MATGSNVEANLAATGSNTPPSDLPEVEVESKVTLQRVVGVPAAVSFIVGSIIGSGIFATPKYVLLYSGSVGFSFVIWLIGGFISLLGGLCYAELGATIPKAGGVYDYLFEAFGPLPAFLFVWLEVLFLRPSDVVLLLVFGAYVIEPIFPGCSASGDFLPLQKLLATAMLGVITFVNCSGAKWTARAVVCFTAIKMIAIAMLIGTGIVRLIQGYTFSFENAMEGSNTDIGLIGLALTNAMYAYGGWHNLNPAAEEMKNPNRDFPLSIWIGIPVVTVSYILVNVGYLTVLTPAELLETDALAVTVANQLYGVMAWIMPLLIACSIFGAFLTGNFGSSRMVNAAARRGHFPQFLAMINTKTRTPIPALIFNCIMSGILLIPESSNFESLLQYTIFLGWTVHLSAVLSLLCLRYRRRHMPRAFKGWLIVPIVMIVPCLYLVITPFLNTPLQSFYWILLILSGIPVYLIIIRYKIPPKSFFDLIDRCTYKLQTMFDLAVPDADELSKLHDDVMANQDRPN